MTEKNVEYLVNSNMDVEQALRSALQSHNKDGGLDQVMVVGVKADGTFYYRSSRNVTRKDALWLSQMIIDDCMQAFR